MIRWVVLALVASCVTSNSTVCDFGLCPNGTACDEAHHACVAPDQLEVCAGAMAGAACTAGAITGTCIDGVCLPSICGDDIVEPSEMCDDGNNDDGDACSADCSTDFTCGNGIVDTVKGEECDDSNHDDHDGCTSTCLRETPVWVEHTYQIEGRQDAAFGYDPVRERMVMFGGYDQVPAITLGDTLEWNGAEWLVIPQRASPGARREAAMSYDAQHHMVMFGGANGNAVYGDTWTWDGATWTVHDQADGPDARTGVALAYDSHRKRSVMFGGGHASGPALADTWEWDGAKWEQQHPPHSPPQRKFAQAAYDPVHGVVVLTGGIDASSTPFDDTWVYDGTDWRNVTPASSRPNLTHAAMIWDPRSQRVLILAGGNPSYQSALWAWDGTSWTTIATTGAVTPGARFGIALASTPSRLVMFGGAIPGNVSNETFFLIDTAWSKPTDPGPRADFSMVGEPVQARLLAYSGITDTSLTRSPTTVAASTSGYAVLANAPPNARALACLAYDPLHREVVMFGGSTGTSGGTPNGETWTWNGSGWTQHVPNMTPGPHVDASCAFDGQHVTLFGGFVGGNPAADAWSWTGTTWMPVTVPAELVKRYGAAAAYDPVRNRMVLFGGLDQTAPFDDTWTYDGTSWTHVAADAFRPPGRWDAGFAWNPARRTLVLAGGTGLGGHLLDAYEWDGSAWHVVAATNLPAMRASFGMATSVDGLGVSIYGGMSSGQVLKDRWELMWTRTVAEHCTASDVDGDGVTGCMDHDCWAVCTPTCPPGTTCAAGAPGCGDGICDAARETCRTCPSDCTCTPICGDGICDPGETCTGDCP